MASFKSNQVFFVSGLLAASLQFGGCLIAVAVPAVGGAAIACWLDYCPPVVEDMFVDPGSRLMSTAKGEGYSYIDISVDFSNELTGPGSVVSASDSRGLRYLGNILKCIYPTDANALITRAEKDKSQTLRLTPRQFVRFELVQRSSAQFKDIKKVTVKYTRLVSESVKSNELSVLISKSLPTLNAVCRSWLRPQVYIITNTLSIGGVTYEFEKSYGRSIELTAASLKEYLTFSNAVNYTVSKGLIELNDHRYVAVRADLYIPGQDDPNDPEDIGKILQRYYDAMNY